MTALETARAARKTERKPAKRDKADKAPRASAADAIINLAMRGAELFHDAGNVAYATVGPRTLPVKCAAFRSWLTGCYHHTSGKAANAEAMASAVATLEAHAVHTGPMHAVHVRIVETDGAIYLHLADDAGTVIVIDADGWRVASTPPVKFKSTKNALPLPMPVLGGDIAELRSFVNAPDDDAFTLLSGYLVCCFRTVGQLPLLVLTGQQGSAKSTTARVLKSLIDPEIISDRSAPRDDRDLSIWSSNSRLLCLDNLSSFPDWLSDCFCRIADGSGFGTRTLYENDAETVFIAKRPVILNGIEDFVTRGDLMERAIVLRHPAIPDDKRRTKAEMDPVFEAARPRLLGAILEMLSAGLRQLPSVDTRGLPRMADACAFAMACEAGSGRAPRFLNAYRDNQADGHALQLADSVITPAIITLVQTRGDWVGTASQLFDALKPAGDKLPHGWPRTARTLSGQLRRIAPALSKVHGLTATNDRANDANRTRVIRIVKADNFANPPSASSGCVRDGDQLRTQPDAPDALFANLSPSEHDLSVPY